MELLNYALNPANEYVMEELFNAGFESGEFLSFPHVSRAALCRHLVISTHLFHKAHVNVNTRFVLCCVSILARRSEPQVS